MKAALKLLSVLTFLVFIAPTVFAQSKAPVNASTSNTSTEANSPGKFVDQNKNGVCDNFESLNKVERGRNFIDKNSDGICDNQSQTVRGNKRGRGCGQGFQHRRGNGSPKGNCGGFCQGYCKKNRFNK